MAVMKSIPVSWRSGPSSDKELNPPHGRPVLPTQITALAVQNDQVVTASSDHGLRIYNVNTGAAVRQLYNKNFGHKEWVTACAWLRDGRVWSGAMDSMLCLWDRRAVRCDNMSAHQGSISALMVDDSDVGISASYDKSLIVWDLQRQQPLTVLSGAHQAPVLTFDWHNSLVVSGDRAGVVAYWVKSRQDINTGQCFNHRPTHKGQVQRVQLASDAASTNVVLSTGTNDGQLIVTDMRTHQPAYQKQIHRASINFLAMSLSNTVVTGSFDSSVKVLDAVMNYQERSTMQSTAGVLCGEMMENLVITGCADGNVNVFDIDTEECLFGYGVDNQGGVNCLATAFNRKRLVTGGDSGTPLLLLFS